MGAASKLQMSRVGEGKVVALLHGSPSTAGAFAALSQALSQAHRVVIPDMPGYGASPPSPRGAPISHSQELLEEALLATAATELALVGFSLGAYRAVDLALRARLRVTAIVAIGGFAGLGDAHRAALRAAAAQIGGLKDFADPSIRRGFALGMVAPGFAEREPAMFQQIEAWLDAVSPASLAEELIASTEAPDLTPRLRELSMPLHALVGELDAAAPLAYSQALVAGVAGAELHVFQGCGHALMVEAPEKTEEAVRAALGTLRVETRERS